VDLAQLLAHSSTNVITKIHRHDLKVGGEQILQLDF
jgi:hypothetical protein